MLLGWTVNCFGSGAPHLNDWFYIYRRYRPTGHGIT